MAKKHEMDMTSGNIFGKMIVFTIPIVLSGILQLLYNAADIVVVGRFAGKEALAAVGATGPLVNLLINLFMGFATGSNVVLATAYGQGNKKKISDTVHTSALLSIICGVILGIMGLFLSKPLLVLRFPNQCEWWQVLHLILQKECLHKQCRQSLTCLKSHLCVV